MPIKKQKDPAARIQKAYAELKQAHDDIKEAHMAIVLRLAIVAEHRDADTGAHILRISEYGCALGRAVGMSERDIEILRFASPLHDIGKIAVPDAILKKPAKLTPEEFKVIEGHTVLGARMFESSRAPILKAAADICRHHHEKWDGTGYPDGLKGDKIPLMARIVTVVDIFDAIVSKRCYKEAWTFDDGLKHIRTLAGTQLDPHLVTAFVKLKPHLKEIYEANRAIQAFVTDPNMLQYPG